MKIKLPKQWPYWCRKYGLRPEGEGGLHEVWSWDENNNPIVKISNNTKLEKYDRHGNRIRRFWYLKGKGRRWRINCHMEFQVSEPYSTFDRWANSTAATLPYVPKTEAEFKIAIDKLIETAVDSWELRVAKD